MAILVVCNLKGYKQSCLLDDNLRLHLVLSLNSRINYNAVDLNVILLHRFPYLSAQTHYRGAVFELPYATNEETKIRSSASSHSNMWI